MVLKDYDVIGIVENGIVIGYVLKDDLGEGTCKEYFRSFSPTELLSDSTPLLHTFYLLEHRRNIYNRREPDHQSGDVSRSTETTDSNFRLSSLCNFRINYIMD